MQGLGRQALAGWCIHIIPDPPTNLARCNQNIGRQVDKQQKQSSAAFKQGGRDLMKREGMDAALALVPRPAEWLAYLERLGTTSDMSSACLCHLKQRTQDAITAMVGC